MILPPIWKKTQFKMYLIDWIANICPVCIVLRSGASTQFPAKEELGNYLSFDFGSIESQKY